MPAPALAQTALTAVRMCAQFPPSPAELLFLRSVYPSLPGCAGSPSPWQSQCPRDCLPPSLPRPLRLVQTRSWVTMTPLRLFEGVISGAVSEGYKEHEETQTQGNLLTLLWSLVTYMGAAKTAMASIASKITLARTGPAEPNFLITVKVPRRAAKRPIVSSIPVISPSTPTSVTLLPMH